MYKQFIDLSLIGYFAFFQGADFVEFDVHLTKDKEVIVYHDFKVKITYKKVNIIYLLYPTSKKSGYIALYMLVGQ